MEWFYIILAFVLTGIVIFIVGTIGNKIVDKADNAMHAKKIRKQREENTLYSRPSESLADKLVNSSPYYAGQRNAAAEADAEPRYCGSCGHKLTPHAKFCNSCGEPVEDLRD